MVTVTLLEYKLVSNRNNPVEKHQWKIRVRWSSDYDITHVQVADARPEDAYTTAIADGIERLLCKHGFTDPGFQAVSEEGNTSANARFNAGVAEARARLANEDSAPDPIPDAGDSGNRILIAAVVAGVLGLLFVMARR